MAQRFLRFPEVQARCGLSRSSIYVRIEQGTFPKPVRIGPNAIAFVESEIDGWVESQITAARGEPAVATA
jgi:prophage regulatory protein